MRHHRNGRTVRLPASYVTESVELGYATTVHTAQGVTADTMHGLVTGEESRQQLYTMLTRGRIANHLYLQVVGDGDPHSLIRPETIHPSTATELLERILARDEMARSATTLQRDQHDPAVRLADAAAHYVDALQVAAEDLAGREVVEALDVAAEQIVPGLIDEPAWPTLRAHLLLLAAHGTDPVAQLAAVAGRRELNSADDRAAVLDWRLDDTGHRNTGQGPLPWLPGIPQGLRDHPVWGTIWPPDPTWSARWPTRSKPPSPTPIRPYGLPKCGSVLPSSVIGDVQVWRAAMQVSPEDRRPTGPVQLQKAARTWQVHLDRQVAGDRSPALQEWGWLLNQLSPNLTQDPFAPMLADRLAALSRAGVDARQLLGSAITTGGPLPDDHAAAAVWWRISRHLTPTVTAQADTDHTFATVRTTRLAELIGADQADTLQVQPCGGQRSLLQSTMPCSAAGGSTTFSEPPACQMPGLWMQPRRWFGASRCWPTRPTDEPGEPPFSAAPADLDQRRAAVRGDRLRRPGRHHHQTRRYDRCGVERSGGSGLGGAGPGGRGPGPWRRRASEQTDADVHRMFTRAMAGRNVRSAATG